MSARTIYSKVSQSSACSPLNFRVMAAEEEENGVERIPTDRADFLLSDFGECECGAALEVNVVGE